MICGFCEKNTKKILDLGKTPVANSFLTKKELYKIESKFNLSLNYCRYCYLIQAPRDINIKEIFNSKYVYYSSVSKSWSVHAKNYCSHIIKKLNLKKNDKIIEIASNDGYLLKNFNLSKFNLLGIEPSKNTALECERKYSIPVIKDFFNLKLVKKKKLEGKADLLIANNVLAHNPNIRDFIESIKTTLSKKGVATIEFPHFYNLFNELQFDTVYHEHYYYFTLRSLNIIFDNFNLSIWHVEELKTHGGSLRIYVSHKGSNKKISISVKKILQKEKKLKLFDYKTYKNFSKKVKKIKKNTLKFIYENYKKNKKIAVYGAAAKGNTFLNFINVNSKIIDTAFDLSRYKVGKYLPGSKIKVKIPDKNLIKKYDIIIILPWNLQNEITKQLKNKIKKDCKIYICIPKIKKTN